jgi:hypothetical protein
MSRLRGVGDALRTRGTGFGFATLVLAACATIGGSSAASPAGVETGVPASAARSFVIDARGSATGLGRVLRIGDFRPQRDATVAAARAAFGRPSSTGAGRNACPIAWRGIGIRILFANFGAGSACAPRLGSAQVAVVRGRRWSTAQGLRVGATPKRLREVYPGADRVGARSYRIVSARRVFGESNGRYAVVSARLSDGRVSSFRLFVGAAGE